MKSSTKVTSKYRITLIKLAREHIKVKEGDFVDISFDKEKNCFLIKKIT